MKILLILTIISSIVILSMASNVDGILVGDARKDSDLILVGKVISFTENQAELETDYVVEVEEYLKAPKNYDIGTSTVVVTSPGLRHYDDPNRAVIYDKLFNVGDRGLFLLYLDDGKLRESLSSFITKSGCTGKQLLDQMYGPSGLSISQNNQTSHLYTNIPIDLIFNAYNLDLISEEKNFEFQVFTPNEKISEKRQIHLQECKRSAEVRWSFVPSVAGKYTFNAILGPNSGGSESFSGVLIEDYIAPPLKQFKSGIVVENIKCKPDLVLIIKTKDGSPACVKPDSVMRLITQGWANDHPPSLFGPSPPKT